MKRLLNDFTQKHGLEAFAFAGIAWAAIRNVASIDTVMDVSGGDEGYYLYNGIANLPVGHVHLYSYFYSLLHWFNSNSIEIYHLSFQLICATTTILFYCALRLFRISIPIAALATLFILYSPAYLERSPATHFSLLVTLVFLIFGLRCKDNLRFLACLAIGFALSACTRPECTLSFAIIIIFGAVAWFTARKAGKSFNTKIPAGVFFFVVILFFVSGNPLGSRIEEYVISGAYAQAKAQAGHISTNPYFDYGKVSGPAFPGAKGVLEFATTNPSEFLWYLKTNAFGLLTNFPFLFLNAYGHATSPMPIRMAQTFIFILPLIIMARRKQFWPLQKDPQRIRLVALLLAVAIPVVMVCILYLPKPSYQIALVFSVYMLWAYLCDKTLPWEKVSRRNKQLLACCAAILTAIASPTIAASWSFRASAPPQPRTADGHISTINLQNISLIRHLEKIPSDKEMLITNTGFHGQSENYGDDLKAFLPNFNEILPPRDARDLVAFIRQNKIEVVVSSTPGEKSTGPQDYLTADFLREKLLALDFQEIDKDFFGKKIFAKGIPLYHLTQ